MVLIGLIGCVVNIATIRFSCFVLIVTSLQQTRNLCAVKKRKKCLLRVHVWSSNGDVPVALMPGKESSARGALQGWISTQKQN